MTRSLKTLATAVLLAAALPAGGGSASAQQEVRRLDGRRPTRVAVTLALADTLSGGDAFRILRRADAEPHDVILFRPGADSATLSEAVEHLLLIRARQGDTARTTGLVRVRRGADAAGAGFRMLPWAGRVMADLARAGRRSIPGAGTVRSVRIWLPPQRGRRAGP